MSDVTKSLILISYIKMILVLALMIIIIIKLYKYNRYNKSIINMNYVHNVKKDFVKKNINKINNACQIILIIYILFGSLIVFEHSMDLYSVIKKSYKKEIVTTLSSDISGEYSTNRHILFQSLATGKELSLNVYSGPVKKNKCFEIHYYPNIRIAEIIREVYCSNNNQK